MRNAPTNTDDVIDSRDVIARIEELQADRAEFTDNLESLQEERIEARSEYDSLIEEHGPDHLAVSLQWDKLNDIERQHQTEYAALTTWDEENAAELKALTELAEQCEGYADDWHHGATLIRDSYFKEYATQLAEDLGCIDRRAAWPYDCIDWERAARELRMGYTSVEFDGVTYWVR